jgi:octaprenyl-diphosphate synthase
MKTAALFSAACELGAFISEASPAVIGSLKTYGTKLGVAYQIYDDILDIAGSEEETGKTLGTDLQKGKFTLPILLLLQSGKDLGSIRELLLKDDPAVLNELADMVDRTGVLENSKKIARAKIAEAIEHLEPIQDNRYAGGLHAIPNHLSHLLDQV